MCRTLPISLIILYWPSAPTICSNCGDFNINLEMEPTNLSSFIANIFYRKRAQILPLRNTCPNKVAFVFYFFFFANSTLLRKFNAWMFTSEKETGSRQVFKHFYRHHINFDRNKVKKVKTFRDLLTGISVCKRIFWE